MDPPSGRQMNDLLLRALRREPIERTPVWFMRQAGRSLPRYRDLKQDRDLLEVTKDPELAARITALPLDYFPVDAAVLFADISTIFLGAGIDVRIEKGVGPVIPEPFDRAERIRSLRPFDPNDTLDFVLETLRILKDRLDVPTVGFVGAPFTLMTYMVESPRSRDRQGTKSFMWREPGLWDDLMSYWSEHLLAFARAQAAAGAAGIQLFDSWAGCLGPADYATYVLPYSKRILDGLRESGIPTINFATGNPALLPLLAEAGGDAIGLDWRVEIEEAWRTVGFDRAVQGNLDPVVLLAGSEVAISRADRILRQVGGRPGHIFNVGHGLLPETDPAVVRDVVDHVHSVDLEALRRARNAAASGRGDAAGGQRTAASARVAIRRVPQRRGAGMTGVLVLNFGEPENPTLEEVVPFLERIFYANANLEDAADEDARRRRSRELAERRAPGLIEEYAQIGASPMNPQAEAQASGLRAEFARRGVDAKVYTAFQFTPPLIPDALAAARADGVERLIGLPIYPLCGPSTNVAALDSVRSSVDAMRWDVEFRAVTGWHRHPLYLALRADAVRRAADDAGIDLADPETRLVFSAHGTPKKYLDEGSRYVEYVEEFCREIARLLGVDRYLLGYQNHTNRNIEWTGPGIDEAIATLDAHRIIVDPVSFMHEQSETLAELDHELREDAEGLGLEFHRVPVPHDDPRFSRVLADLAQSQIESAEIESTDPEFDLAFGPCRCRPAPGCFCLNSVPRAVR